MPPRMEQVVGRVRSFLRARPAWRRAQQVLTAPVGHSGAVWVPRVRVLTARWRDRFGARSRGALDSSRQQLVDELAFMKRLYDISLRRGATTELAPLCVELLDASLALQNTDCGYLQLVHAETRTLEVVAQRGLGSAFLDEIARAGRGGAPSTAERGALEAVDVDSSVAAQRDIAARAGFREVQITRLLTSANELLGTITTHLGRADRVSERRPPLSDLYARQVAELIQRVQAEQARSQLVSLVENSGDLIGIASLGGQARFLNPAGRRLLGIDSDEKLRVHLLEYVHETNRERFEREAWTAVARDGRWEGEVLLRNLITGEPVPVIQNMFFIREADTGRPIALAAIGRDDSERKRSEAALRVAHDELTRAGRLSSMGELVTAIAHEVSQPLAAIVTNGHACLHWLAREAPNLDEVQAAVQRILEDGHRAGAVVHRLRGRALQRARQESLLDAPKLVRETLALAEHELMQERVHVELDLASTLALPGDRVQLQQVLLDLIVNAIAAMRDVRDRTRALTIAAHDRGSTELVLRVRDAGTGVAPEQLDRMFEAFYTTNPARLGLGLSISQRIVTGHGGRIWASPNEDYGLTLWLVLPGQPWPEPQHP